MRYIILSLVTIVLAVVLVNVIIDYKSNTIKPISYPEEIQIAKAGDTLIVSSVSDSIYIAFKKK